MRIGVDARPLCEKYQVGISVYLKSLLEGFGSICPGDLELILYAHKPFNPEYSGLKFKVRNGNGTVPGSVWVQTVLLKHLADDKPDLFWGTAHVLPYFLSTKCKSILTVHDLVFKRYPETMSNLNFLINRALVPFSIRKTDVIAADSDSTAEDLKKYFTGVEKKTKVVKLGVSRDMLPVDDSKARRMLKEKLNISFPYVLTVGSFEPRKNIAVVYDAFRKIYKDLPHHLVCVGTKGWKTGKLQKEFLRGPLRDRIHMIGYQDSALMPSLYSVAEAFVFPSLYEGFGIPVLEAMACGCPVITSRASSLMEITGASGLNVDFNDAAGIAGFIKRLNDDKAWRNRQVKEGFKKAERFKWEDTASKMIKIFREICI